MEGTSQDIGRSQPTNRTLAWGIDADDWDGGRLTGNYLLHYGNTTITNIYGILLQGHTQDIDVNANVLHGLNASTFGLRISGSGTKQGIRVFDNQFQFQGTDMRVIVTDFLPSVSFSDNVYDTDRAANAWFTIQGTNVDFNNWVAQTSDTGSQAQRLSYPDPNRTVETYQTSLGQAATLDAFLQEAKQQSKFNWRTEYTAGAVNAYIKRGFAPVGSQVP